MTLVTSLLAVALAAPLTVESYVDGPGVDAAVGIGDGAATDIDHIELELRPDVARFVVHLVRDGERTLELRLDVDEDGVIDGVVRGRSSALVSALAVDLARMAPSSGADRSPGFAWRLWSSDAGFVDVYPAAGVSEVSGPAAGGVEERQLSAAMVAAAVDDAARLALRALGAAAAQGALAR